MDATRDVELARVRLMVAFAAARAVGYRPGSLEMRRLLAAEQAYELAQPPDGAAAPSSALDAAS